MKLPIGFRAPAPPTRPPVLELGDARGERSDQSAIVVRQTIDPRSRRMIGEIKRNGVILALFVTGCSPSEYAVPLPVFLLLVAVTASVIAWARHAGNQRQIADEQLQAAREDNACLRNALRGYRKRPEPAIFFDVDVDDKAPTSPPAAGQES